MLPFLETLAIHLAETASGQLGDTRIILPNRRAGLFLQRHLARHTAETTWAPRITAISDFIDEMSLLELSDPRVLQNLVRIMGEQHLMINAMKRRLGDETKITIGTENEMEELSDFSLVTRKFHLDNYDGLLGVLGPTRMQYNRVLSLLAGMAEELQQLEIKGR